MHRIPLNHLARRQAALGEDLSAAVSRVARSGWYLLGPELASLEAALSAFLGGRLVVGVASGTDAIALALLGVGCQPGDQVVTAANAGMYTTLAAVGARLEPRFADVDAETLCLSPDTVAAALTPRTRAVVVTHLYGRLAAVDQIAELCRMRGIALVEDCAQAIGARAAGGPAGTFGSAAAFSFYPTKNLGALGDAGAVVTGDPEVEQRVRRLCQYGWSRKYHVTESGGRNSRMDEIQAAALVVALPHLDAWNARRRVIASRYAEALRREAGRLVMAKGGDYVGHLAVVIPTSERTAVRSALEYAGIATEVHYPVPDHRQTVWNGRFNDVQLPVTEALAERVLTVPCFPELHESEIDRVCEALHAL